MSLLTESDFYKNTKDENKPTTRATFSRLLKKGMEPIDALAATETRFTKRTISVSNSKQALKPMQIVTWTIITLTTGYIVYASAEAYGAGVEGWFIAALFEAIIVYLSYLRLKGFWTVIPKVILLAFIWMTVDALTNGVSIHSEKIARLEQNRDLLVSDREAIGNKWNRAELSKNIIAVNEKIDTLIDNVSISENITVKVRCLFLAMNVFLAHLLMLWKEPQAQRK